MFEIDENNINKAYEQAKKIFSQVGIDTEKVLEEMGKIHISLPCWQGDDIVGFESDEELSGGGILVTGNWSGRARNGNELRQDLEKALSLIPGKHRVNLHAIYAEAGTKFVDRDQISIEHFAKWIKWAKENEIGLDFNPTFFSHEKANSGYTLSSKNKEIRTFWVNHGRKSREIASAIGEELEKQCVNNVWIPDGSKDLPADRWEHREILKDSLDSIFSVKYDKKYILDSVESKLFGIGSESYVVGSHEFYMGYALKNDVALCLDMGHFHPTENIADKISSILTFSEDLLIHVSRGVRWDSDHVPILNDELLELTKEIRRGNSYDKVHFALDFFDASINRITGWIIGARATLKAIMISLLEPAHLLREEEIKGNFGNRLALMEEFKNLPYSNVWEKYCLDKGVPTNASWLEVIKRYEEEVLTRRK